MASAGCAARDRQSCHASKPAARRLGASRSTAPHTARVGTPVARARAATRTAPLPSMLCASSRPSPVTTRSESARAASRPTRSAISAAPGDMLAAQAASSAAPAPPAAPAPGVEATSRPVARARTSAHDRSPASSSATSSRVAPFCGANTAAAPSGPCSGLVTSAAMTMSVSCSRGSRRVRSTSAMRCSQAPPGSTTAPSAASESRAECDEQSGAAVRRRAPAQAHDDARRVGVEGRADRVAEAVGGAGHGCQLTARQEAQPAGRGELHDGGRAVGREGGGHRCAGGAVRGHGNPGEAGRDEGVERTVPAVGHRPQECTGRRRDRSEDAGRHRRGRLLRGE